MKTTDMKRLSMAHLLLAALPMALALLTASCSDSAKQQEKSKYQEWRESLTDSLECVREQMRETNHVIDSLHSEVERLLPEFVHVNNPREVEGYTIYRGWNNRYPLSTTGLVARMSENTAFELVATLRGGEFDRIELSCGDDAVSSDTVPYDRALNYRADGLNTVAFSGHSADEIGAFVARHRGEKITVSYLGKGLAAKVTLPSDQAEMITATWDMVNAHHSARLLEQKLNLLESKCKILESKGVE